jgi:hypothetical protein
MARKLLVEIVGDSTSLDRAFKKSSASATRFGRDMSKVGRGGFAATGAFSTLGRSVAFASGAFLGGFGLVSALKAAVQEQADFQKANAQTRAVLKSTAEVAGLTAGDVDKLSTSLSQVTGIDDELVKSGENILLTFTNIRNVAGKNNDVFTQAIKLSTDLATAMGLDLKQASLQVGKALNDPARGFARLQRIGVAFSKQQITLIKRLQASGDVMGAQRIILRELTKEFGGSAKAAGDTFPGKLNKLKETVLNMSGAIAGLLTPQIERLVDRLVKWTQNTENQQRVMRDARRVIKDVGSVISTLSGALKRLNDVTGSTEGTLKLLLGTLVAFKGLQLVGGLAGVATALGSAGAGATTFSGALAGNAGLIALTGAAAFALTTLALKATGADKALRAAGGGVFDFAAKLGVVKDPTKQFVAKLVPGPGDIKRFREAIQKLMSTRNISKQNAIDVFVQLHPRVNKHDVEVAAGILAQVQAPAGALGPITAAQVRKRAKAPTIGEVDDAETKKEKRARLARIRQSRDAARQAVQDRAELQVERAQATKGLTDDLAALRKLQALLKRRIRGGHDTIELERQQLQVDQQIADVQKQQAEARKEAERKAAQQRQTRQFRLLGLGPGGEDPVAGVKGLKRQLNAATKALDGTFLDTRKTQSLVSRIRKILAGGLGAVGKDVRQKIQDIIDDLQAKLKNASVDVTKFQTVGRGQFSLAGAHPAGSGVVVNGGIHLHGVQNVKQLEEELAKRRKQRAHARRGTR